MHKIKVINVLQGKVLNKNNTYSIGLVTAYGTASISWANLPAFIKNNKHLEKVLSSSVIDSNDIIGKYIFVQNKRQKYTTSVAGSYLVEYRIRV